jgi:hypothetical protein|tara:strand:- start:362 stop:754 length:393 start_codon:yes stop_codon:yes gene_type:complete
MKKNDLKQLIKPIVKDCIHEILIEEGLLSNVVAEVAKGMQGNLVVEGRPTPSAPVTEKKALPAPNLNAHRQGLMEAVGTQAYNGVNLFEGTTPTTTAPPKGHADLGDPRDAGVDISSLVGNASHIWRSMK